jgi:hypothetical protein
MSKITLGLLAALAVATVAHAEERAADTSYLEAPIPRFTYEDADLARVASDLGGLAGIRVAVAPRVLARGEKVSASEKNVLWQRALGSVLADHRLIARSAPGGIVLDDPEPAARVTLSVKGASVRQTVAEIVGVSSLSVVVAPDVTGTLDLDVKDAPWPKALKAVLEPRKLHAVLHGRVLVVSAQEPALAEIALGDVEPLPPIEWPLRVPGEPLRLLDVVVEDGQVSDVMDAIGARVEKNIIVEPGFRAWVNHESHGTPWREAVETIAAETSLCVHEGSGVIALDRPEALTVTMSGEAARALHAIALATSRSLVVAPDVTGELLVALRDAPFGDAVSAIGAAGGARATHLGARGEMTVVSKRALDARDMPEQRSLVDGLDGGHAGEALGREIDVTVEDADLGQVLDRSESASARTSSSIPSCTRR